MTIALLYGGRTREHEVSRVSASGILRELDAIDDVSVSPIGIDRGGTWYLQELESRRTEAGAGGALSIESDPARAVMLAPAGGLRLADGNVLAVDCAFPIVHGETGEDGVLQGALETAGVPYIGSGVGGSAVGIDKLRSKRLWEQAGLPVVPYLLVDRSDEPDFTVLTRNADRAILENFGYPVFIKPNTAGSSVGTSRVNKPEALRNALESALEFDRVVLVEQALSVREIETSILGNAQARAFPPGEVIPTHEFYDYDAKYEDPNGADLRIPADIPPDTARTIEQMCLAAYHAVGASGMARVDCFIEREGSAIYLNEINTLPGFTPISMYPKMVERGGVPYRDLLMELVRLGIERSATSVPSL